MDAETESSGKALKLLEEAGIPDWAREVEESEQEKSEPAEEEDQGRRSRRARRDVVYDESLTELQFCDLVESGATPVRSARVPLC